MAATDQKYMQKLLMQVAREAEMAAGIPTPIMGGGTAEVIAEQIAA